MPLERCRRTLKVTDQGQSQGHAIAVELLLDSLPRSNQDNGLGSIASGSLEDGIEILP